MADDVIKPNSIYFAGGLDYLIEASDSKSQLTVEKKDDGTVKIIAEIELIAGTDYTIVNSDKITDIKGFKNYLNFINRDDGGNAIPMSVSGGNITLGFDKNNLVRLSINTEITGGKTQHGKKEHTNIP
jgi:hypothetical protein